MKNILKVSISYSWDSEEHKKWVRILANYLIEYAGMDVTLDQYDLAVGKNMTYFMETAIEKADKVLMILTPNYKEKADGRVSGVGYEHSIISSNLFELQKDNNKFKPILRAGNLKESVPVFIKSLLYHDMTKDDRFESDVFNLVKMLNDEPLISKPKIGSKLNLQLNIDPVLEQASHLIKDIDIANKRINYTQSWEAGSKAVSELQILFKNIQDKSAEYKTQINLNVKSYYKEERCIINMLGLCLNIFYRPSQSYDFEKNELIISIWDKPLSMDNSYNYAPWEQPKELGVIIFKPIINDNLDVVWVNNNNKLFTHELNGYCYSTLFDFVRKKLIK